MGKLIVFCFLFFFVSLAPPSFAKGNLGHRLGGDYFRHLPENSLAVLKKSLSSPTPLMRDKNFVYAEFDVQETSDGELVVFHDKTLERMLPFAENQLAGEVILDRIETISRKRPKWKNVEIQNLQFSEIRSLRLAGAPEETVPTVVEVLKLAAELEIQKPIAVEIKRLHTDLARTRLLEIVRDYRVNYADRAKIRYESQWDYPDKLPVFFLAFKKKFKKSFPEDRRRSFCHLIEEYLLGGVFEARKHRNNLCRS